MKWFLIFWGGPILFLGAWYGLSYNDISFGFFMLTRQTHDLVFQVYGNVLGIPPETIPPLVMRAIVVDTIVLYSIILFRRRKKIIAWWKQRQASLAERSSLSRNDSLSRAP